MKHEVVVVGGGVGGLTVAALLAARGVDVCLFERAPQVGGCAGNFQKYGYDFELTSGLYTGWQPSEIHERVFTELPVKAPEVRPLRPSFVVRSGRGSDVIVSNDDAEFEQQLQHAFPDCAKHALAFYREIRPLRQSLRNAMLKVPDFQTASPQRRLSAFLPHVGTAMQLLKLEADILADHLRQTSVEFHDFIDRQLQLLAQTTASQCSFLHAAVLLDSAREMFSIKGGSIALAEALATSIAASGGRVRLDAPVLRLAYDENGAAVGVDLLSGERVEASRAIISNLTVWDTYGKLMGVTRVPAEVRTELKKFEGRGAFLMFLSLDASAAEKLPAEHVIARGSDGEILTVSISPRWDSRAPEGKRAMTVRAATDVEEWFTFHEDATAHEAKDQQMTERCWQLLHELLPELGESVELIETATPISFYEDTRRKLGIVGGLAEMFVPRPDRVLRHRTFLPNVFRVGDTCLPGAGLAAVTQSALIVADEITRGASSQIVKS